MSSAIFYPTSPREALLQEYAGKSISDVPTPAAVINVAAVRRNCERMLQTVKDLNLGWRAHVKTHKTVEVTRLQVGEDISRPANLVVSTLAEAEFILPLLKEWTNKGRKVNVLYGLPITRNALPRLAAVTKALGEGSISILLDDLAQVPLVTELHTLSGVVPHAHIKIDMGGRRAGVILGSERFNELLKTALGAHKLETLVLAGFYSHAGHSYGGDSRVAAIKMMRAELEAMRDAADELLTVATGAQVHLPTVTISGGASPTALSVQNLLGGHVDVDAQDRETGTPELQTEVDSLSALFAEAKERGYLIEIHAGVYPLLDLQQLAAHSMTASRLSWRDIAFTVVAEVHSTYPGRGEDGTPEALIGAGGLALGRETCKAYSGMAVVSPWGRKGVELPACDVEDYEGWTVGRFSQEHGILTWAKGNGRKEGSGGIGKSAESGLRPQLDMVEVGQKVRLWPNHACITSSHFGWYFVVDEDQEGDEDKIVDVWIKARGW